MAGDLGIIRTDTGLHLDKGNQVFNVKHTDFAGGAEGDGVTDDTLAIQAAMDFAGSNTVFFPAGQYVVSDTLLIKAQGARLVGGGMSGKTVSAEIVNGSVQLLGVTSGMTIMRCSGVNDDGTTVMQAGPVIEGIAFVDTLGQATQTPGDMTMLEIRVANRWKLRECGFFFANLGLKASKDTIGGSSADCAQWKISGCTLTFCLTGGWLNTFSGTVDTTWVNGCGTGFLVDEDAVVQQASGVGIRGCKFDILEPTISTAFTPGVGIRVAQGQNITISECLMETQPQLDLPTTTGVLVDGDTSVTRVVVENCFFSNLRNDVLGTTAEFLRVKDCITRSGSAGMTVDSHVRFTTVVEGQVVGCRSAGLINPSIIISGTSTLVTIFGFAGTVEGSTTLSGMAMSVWVTGSCTWNLLNTGVADFREVASGPSAPDGNHAFLYADDVGSLTTLKVLFASGGEHTLATQGALVTTLADEDAPSVNGVTLAVSGGTVNDPILDFNDGIVGQTFTLLAAHAITVTDGTNILLNGSVDYVMAAGDTLTLTMFNDQVWEETSRKVNL